jgi:hypothetical protein
MYISICKNIQAYQYIHSIGYELCTLKESGPGHHGDIYIYIYINIYIYKCL